MWKDIQNWENYYEVSDSGDVRNKITGHLIEGDVNNAGYHRVALYRKGHVPEKKRFYRHRLVASHFIPNPQGLPEVNHKDLDKGNNSLCNLEWVSRKENERHCRKLGVKLFRPFQVELEDGTITEYNTLEELSSQIGVTTGCVRYWLLGTNRGYRNHRIERIQYI